MTNLTVDGGDRPRDPDGVPVFFNAYGLADREKTIANTIHTRFNIGSINKAFTQVTINQLIRDGNLSATDTLGQFHKVIASRPKDLQDAEGLLVLHGAAMGRDRVRRVVKQFAAALDDEVRPEVLERLIRKVEG